MCPCREHHAAPWSRRGFAENWNSTCKNAACIGKFFQGRGGKPISPPPHPRGVFGSSPRTVEGLGGPWSTVEDHGGSWRVLGKIGESCEAIGVGGCNAPPRLHPPHPQNIKWVENLPVNLNRKIKRNPWIPTKWQSQVESVRIPPIPMPYPLRVPHDLPDSVEVTGHISRVDTFARYPTEAT
jgi:hypothetical protein